MSAYALRLLARALSLTRAVVNPSGAQPSMVAAPVAELVDAPVFQAGGINARRVRALESEVPAGRRVGSSPTGRTSSVAYVVRSCSVV
jgi:hypothetical protein